MPGNCSFQKHWLEESDFKLWLEEVEHKKYEAFCNLCRKIINIQHDGRYALTSHRNGKNHAARETPLRKRMQLTLPFANSSSNVVSASNSSANVVFASNSSTNVVVDSTNVDSTSNSNAEVTVKSNEMCGAVSKWMNTTEVLKAEILWAINKVVTHSSNRSAALSSDLFPLLFPDSMIAKKFSMKKDKTAYVVSFGLGPYFADKMKLRVKNKSYFAISIDESLNKVSVKAQLDVIVRFYSDTDKNLNTEYFTSIFLEECTSEKLCLAIIDGLQELEVNILNMIQLSLDGPNVNLKLFRDLRKQLTLTGKSKLLDTGTCTLHIVNGAYKTGHSKAKWLVNDFLRNIYYFFYKFPSRRAAYKKFGKSEVFPKKFCAVRWLENIDCLKRAVECIEPLKLYVAGVQKKPPDSTVFHKMKNGLTDKFLRAKIFFMISIAEELQSFLTVFQSNSPLFPFLYREIMRLIYNVGNRFLTEIIYDTKIDKKFVKSILQIEIGFGATEALKGFSVAECLEFREQCLVFMKGLYSKLIEKLPFNNDVVKGASCLTPEIMLDSKKNESRIKVILQQFVEYNILEAEVADSVKRDYLSICNDHLIIRYLKTYRNGDELDKFLFEMNEIHSLSRDLVEFIKIVCVLFHGQAAVERSFSENKEFLVANLTEESLIAQRHIFNHMKALKFDFQKLDITASMIQYVKNSSSKRTEHLKLRKESTEEEHNRKRRAMQEVKMMEIKKLKIEESSKSEIKMLTENIERMKKKLL